MEEQVPSSDNKNFKFKELKVYSSTDWLADNKKKYRQVFDRYETTYIYAELAFYNKVLDSYNWEVNVKLKCFEIKNNKKQICTLTFRKKISKFDNIVYVREGWGNKKEGTFWKKGTYYWEAWSDGEKLASKYFYVEEAGEDETAEDNPFLEVESLRLYEGRTTISSMTNGFFIKNSARKKAGTSMWRSCSETSTLTNPGNANCSLSFLR